MTRKKAWVQKIEHVRFLRAGVWLKTLQLARASVLGNVCLVRLCEAAMFETADNEHTAS